MALRRLVRSRPGAVVAAAALLLGLGGAHGATAAPAGSAPRPAPLPGPVASLPALTVRGASTAGAACGRGLATLVTVAVPLPRAVRVTDDRVEVLLPRGYCTGTAERYPVLFLLHGTGDTYRSWADRTDLLAYDQEQGFGVILVMPDGGHDADAGWYSDWVDGRYQWESYDTRVLPGYLNATFRTLPGDQAIAGVSMGGFGALSYAARHPGMFKAAASFSGAVDMLYGAPASGLAFSVLHDRYGTPGESVWGGQVSDEKTWAEHNPTSLAPELAGVKLFLASGTGTPGGAYGDDPADPGAYGLENGVFQMNLSLVRALDRAGVAHSDHFYPGGYHGWPYWQADLHWALPLMVQALGPPRP